MLILKHLFDWSYDDLEREVRANLVYRMFTRIDAGDVPDAKTILKIARALGPEVIEQLHRQVIEVAKRAGVTHGRRECGVGRSGRADSQSAAECDPARADHWVRSAIAQDARRDGQELSKADGDHARGAA